MGKHQKLVEKSLVRTFFEKVLGQTVRRLLGRHPPRPDVYCVVERGGTTALVEVELVEYHVDTRFGIKGGSPGERLYDFCRRVQDSLRRRLSKKPIKVDVGYTLIDASAVNISEARAFADELVRLARGFDFSVSEVASIEGFQPEFPLLARYVQTMTLRKVNYFAVRWRCTDVSIGSVGASPKIVAALVQRKSKKKYKWAKNTEKWLLVCASGRTIVGHAGPPIAATALQDPDLLQVCQNSPFDRVYFTDLTRGWKVCLK